MATYVLRCERCRTQYEGRGDWRITMKGGVLTHVTCPECADPDDATVDST